jgi:hypothetical protein
MTVMVTGVGVEAEQVVERSGGGVGFGEHAPGPGASSLPLVEEHGFLDAGEALQEFSYAHVDAVAVGFADHEPGDHQRQHAAQSVDPDFLVGEVVHG